MNQKVTITTLHSFQCHSRGNTMNDIMIYPTPHEQRLLQQKAAEHGMTVQEFVAYLIREAINQSTVKIRTMVKN